MINAIQYEAKNENKNICNINNIEVKFNNQNYRFFHKWSDLL